MLHTRCAWQTRLFYSRLNTSPVLLLLPAALDSQMISQYGQGSGATFGIAASTPHNNGDIQLWLNAMLAMKPLPNVFSWSFSTFTKAPSKERSGDEK